MNKTSTIICIYIIFLFPSMLFAAKSSVAGFMGYPIIIDNSHDIWDHGISYGGNLQFHISDNIAIGALIMINSWDEKNDQGVWDPGYINTFSIIPFLRYYALTNNMSNFRYFVQVGAGMSKLSSSGYTMMPVPDPHYGFDYDAASPFARKGEWGLIMGIGIRTNSQKVVNLELASNYQLQLSDPDVTQNIGITVSFIFGR